MDNILEDAPTQEDAPKSTPESTQEDAPKSTPQFDSVMDDPITIDDFAVDVPPALKPYFKDKYYNKDGKIRPAQIAKAYHELEQKMGSPSRDPVSKEELAEIFQLDANAIPEEQYAFYREYGLDADAVKQKMLPMAQTIGQHYAQTYLQQNNLAPPTQEQIDAYNKQAADYRIEQKKLLEKEWGDDFHTNKQIALNKAKTLPEHLAQGLLGSADGIKILMQIAGDDKGLS